MGKGRLKVKKPKRQDQTRWKDREGPSEDQQKYIDQVSNPRTPEDLVLALQNPSSPAYKQMMNVMAARFDNIAIIEMLIQRNLVEREEAAKRERDEIFKELIAQELAHQKEFIQYQAMLAQAVPPLKSVSEEAILRKEIEERANTISLLKTEIVAIEKSLSELDQAAARNSNDFREEIKRENQEFYDNLIELNEKGIVMPLVAADGEVILPGSDLYRKIMLGEDEDPIETPIKVMDVVGASMLLHAAQSELSAAENHRPDIKEQVESLMMPDPETSGGISCVQREFKKFFGKHMTKLTDDPTEDISKALLAILRDKDNIEARKLYAAHLKASAPNRTQRFAEAQQNRKDHMILEGELLNKNRELNKLEVTQAVALKTVEQYFGSGVTADAKADTKVKESNTATKRV